MSHTKLVNASVPYKFFYLISWKDFFRSFIGIIPLVKRLSFVRNNPFHVNNSELDNYNMFNGFVLCVLLLIRLSSCPQEVIQIYIVSKKSWYEALVPFFS